MHNSISHFQYVLLLLAFLHMIFCTITIKISKSFYIWHICKHLLQLPTILLNYWNWQPLNNKCQLLHVSHLTCKWYFVHALLHLLHVILWSITLEFVIAIDSVCMRSIAIDNLYAILQLKTFTCWLQLLCTQYCNLQIS